MPALSAGPASYLLRAITALENFIIQLRVNVEGTHPLTEKQLRLV